MSDVTECIRKNIAWMSTFKQVTGYGGPVTHYWKNCLHYIGPGFDWRYEGLMSAYANLYRTTHQSFFLNAAVECGDFLVRAQLPNGRFSNSAFESNPSFGFSGTPHESAAVRGLIELIKLLQEQKKPFQSYRLAVQKNLQEIQWKLFWDSTEKTFAQYEKGRAMHVRNRFVPNKIATACEAFLDYYALTKDLFYKTAAVKASEYIIRFQEQESPAFGGIYQSNERNYIITLYTARCVPVLKKLFELTGDFRFLESALAAVNFLKKQENTNGFFDFGYAVTANAFEKRACPQFIAGAGDIFKAFYVMRDYFSYPIQKGIKGLIKTQLRSGAFPTALGLAFKNQASSLPSKPCWRDQLSVIGWNDKALQFLSLCLEQDAQISADFEFEDVTLSCSDGTLTETSAEIRITGSACWRFPKNALFSSPMSSVKSSVYTLANSNTIGLNALGKKGWTALTKWVPE